MIILATGVRCRPATLYNDWYAEDTRPRRALASRNPITIRSEVRKRHQGPAPGILQGHVRKALRAPGQHQSPGSAARWLATPNARSKCALAVLHHADPIIGWSHARPSDGR